MLEFRASSSQRFELGLKTATQHVSKRIHPFAGVWVRAAIPLRFYRQGLGNANDLAATVNQPRNSYRAGRRRWWMVLTGPERQRSGGRMQTA